MIDETEEDKRVRQADYDVLLARARALDPPPEPGTREHLVLWLYEEISPNHNTTVPTYDGVNE